MNIRNSRVTNPSPYNEGIRNKESDSELCEVIIVIVNIIGDARWQYLHCDAPYMVLHVTTNVVLVDHFLTIGSKVPTFCPLPACRESTPRDKSNYPHF